MKNILLMLVLLGATMWQPLFAQKSRITGVVTDSLSGEGIPGVNVRVEGTTTGTATGLDGDYSIMAEPTDELVFSFVGYGEKTVTVGNRTNINVTLTEELSQLQEIVVIGYGQEEKRDATGALETVKAKDFNKGVISSPEELIQGKAAGVQITQASGEPGAGVNVRIRGTSSVRAGNNPLFVVDGIPLAGDAITGGGVDIGRGTGSSRNPLNFLNPNDIASIDILKDASATAIYGSRGANGVILITTKSGQGAKNRITFSTQGSVSRAANTYDLLERDEFLEAYENAGGDLAVGDLGADTDWQDEIFRTAISQKHDLSYATTYNNGNVRVGLGYQDQVGIVENSSLERLNARLNAQHRFLNDKLTINFQGTVSRLNDEAPPIFNDTGFEGDLLSSAYSGNPTWPADPTVQPSNNFANPNSYLEYFLDEAETDRYLLGASAKYDITNNLAVTVNGGYDRSSGFRGAAFSSLLGIGGGINGNGRGAYTERDLDSYLFEVFGNYKINVGSNSKLEALLGYSYQKFNQEGITVRGWGFTPTDEAAMISDLEASANRLMGAIDGQYQQFGYREGVEFYTNRLFPSPAQEEINENVSVPVSTVTGNMFDFSDELQSFFTRLKYTLNDKYLFTGTVRVDGSTKFGRDNKYGIFPSGAFAWRLADEDFVPDFFDDLKFRIGYGITGNQEIPHNQHRERQQYTDITINEGGEILGGEIANVAFGNDAVSWEETRQANAGLDFAFVGGRLSGSLDFYRRNTTDLLLKVIRSQPAPNEFAIVNLDADVINKGIELILNYQAIATKDLSLDISVNGAYNDNVIQNFPGPPINTATINGQGLTGAFAQRIQDGYPLFAYFLRDFRGINEDGLSEYNVDAQEFIGKSPLPKFNAGLNISVTYKNWDLSTFMYGQFGHYIYNNTANAFFSYGSLANARNITQEALEYALENGESPSNTPDASTRYLESGDFWRMQNLNLGYNLPVEDGSFLKNFRIFASAQNLFVITDYSGLDPEINVDKSIDDIPSAGIDYTAYPRARTYTLGLNLSF
ncbi:SusC/RagA family TonB-linked outer membrane protein [Roseivirga sp. BDSF3-8]|uniref:SusC/RagA family TonB-linked outer membrane protein n=1 Tax=Roseivirga sp. BDSF3-8 TaxID=3241598 RepID=UPI0035325C95